MAPWTAVFLVAALAAAGLLVVRVVTVHLPAARPTKTAGLDVPTAGPTVTATQSPDFAGGVVQALDCPWEDLDGARGNDDLVVGSVGKPMTVRESPYTVIYTIRSLKQARLEEPIFSKREQIWLVAEVSARAAGRCPVQPSPASFKVIDRDGTDYPVILSNIVGEWQVPGPLTNGATTGGRMFFAVPRSALNGGRLTVTDEHLDPYGYWKLDGTFALAKGPDNYPQISEG